MSPIYSSPNNHTSNHGWIRSIFVSHTWEDRAVILGGSSKLKTKCTARYSAEKTHHVLYLHKAGASRISNMILRGPHGDQLRTTVHWSRANQSVAVRGRQSVNVCE